MRRVKQGDGGKYVSTSCGRRIQSARNRRDLAPVSARHWRSRRKPCRGSEASATEFWEEERWVSLHAVCISPSVLVAVMFKAQLPATRVIARRLYSSRGKLHTSLLCFFDTCLNVSPATQSLYSCARSSVRYPATPPHPTLCRTAGHNLSTWPTYSIPRHVLTHSSVFARGYAEPGSTKFSRAKPHLNIGTIGVYNLDPQFAHSMPTKPHRARRPWQDYVDRSHHQGPLGEWRRVIH